VNEWIAMNTMEIYNNTHLVYGFVSEFCTPKSCPEMTAGPKYSYLWEDAHDYVKPTAMPAYQYVEALFLWVSQQLDDDSIFPQTPQPGRVSKNFLPTVKKIWKRLARVYFHIYCHHWKNIVELEAEPHLNTCFKHFFYFAIHYELLALKDFEPVEELVKKIQTD